MQETKKEIKRTITTIFVVPTLKIPKDALRNNGFINGFTSDSVSDKIYENSVYLLFKPEQIDQFREFLDSEYERTKSILDEYDHPNGFVVVVYKLDDEFDRDFKLIKQGKYSKTSPAFKKEFPETVKIVKNGAVRTEVSLQYRIFNRTEDLVKFWEDKLGEPFDNHELWSGYFPEDEILTEEKLREYGE